MSVEGFFEDRKFTLSLVAIFLLIAYVIFVVVGSGEEATESVQIQRPKVNSALNLADKEVTVRLATERKIPEKVSVFSIKSPKDSKKEASNLASKFGFSGQSKSKEMFRWVKRKKSLEISKDLSEVVYKDFSIGPVKTSATEESIISKAKEFLAKKSLTTDDLELSERSAYMVSSPTHLGNAGSFQQADYVQIYFNQKLGDYFVFGSSPIGTSVTMTVNKKGEVLNLVYNRVRAESGETYKIKNLEEATRRIKTEGIVVEAYSDVEHGPITPSAFDTILIEDYFLAYLLEKGNSFLQPIYIFRGRGFASVLEEDVFIYVPALEDKWLK